MNIFVAIVAGLVGTVVFSMVLVLAPRMGMPRMDIVSMLSTMFNPKGNLLLGWVIHFMMGVIFALLYAVLWSSGVGTAGWLGGLEFGIVHWLIVGLIMGLVPMLHAGIKAGTAKAPGLYMTNGGGVMAFMGGLIGHAIFGLVVGLMYGLLIH